MKLLVTSGGLMNDSMVSVLKDLAQKPFNELNLAFIPTAANLEEGDKDWFIDDLNACKNLGLSQIDIVDISALPRKIWEERLNEADILLFEGGMTYYLRYWIKQSGLEDLLPELLKSRVYIGISAGSIVTGPSMVLSDSEKAFVEATGIKLDDKGLGLVDFLVAPHINSTYFPDSTFENLEKLSQDIPYPIYALDDQSAVVVNGEHIEVVSEGEWKKFNDN